MARKTSKQQFERNKQIVIDHARGLTWDKIGELHNLTARRAQQIVREWYEHEDRAEVPGDLERINEEILVLDQAIEEYAELAAATTNESVKLGALNAKIRTQDRRIALYRATGVLPSELRRIQNRIDVAKWNDAFEEAFHRLEMEIPSTVIPDGIMHRFYELLGELTEDSATTRAREAAARKQEALEKKKRARRFEKQRRDLQRERYAEVHHRDDPQSATG